MKTIDAGSKPIVDFNQHFCSKNSENPVPHPDARKQYFDGIKENLELLTKLYDESWSMRLYFDLDDPGDTLMSQLCHLGKVSENLKSN